MINEDQVRHIAKLSRLGLSDEEIKKFSSQLSSVFEYIEVLNEVDTDGVEPTLQVTGLESVSGKDEIKCETDPEELLKCTELPLERHQIRVKPIFE